MLIDSSLAPFVEFTFFSQTEYLAKFLNNGRFCQFLKWPDFSNVHRCFEPFFAWNNCNEVEKSFLALFLQF